ncbi:biotin/lipoyl-binding protein, partial [Methylobacterium sp. GXS13]|uniref:efflux RND transporter periplasmic adaptor subunit n=1 Tax=Methylobacterium sp. GXS13 TaxID=1730094 RepID=UPI001FCDC75D
MTRTSTAITPSPVRRRARLLGSAALLALALGACNPKQVAAPTPPVPEVGFVTVTPQAIPYLRDLPGRVAPMRIAEVRSRVSGLVIKRLFEQGSQVKEGDILYKIDPAPYQVELASAEAALARQEAALVLARQQADRLEQLLTRATASQAQDDAALPGQKQAGAEGARAQGGRGPAQAHPRWAARRP